MIVVISEGTEVAEAVTAAMRRKVAGTRERASHLARHEINS